MHISKLKIKNFKCFDEVEINFDPNFNLIIGENNSGKSTIFDALRLWQLAFQKFLKDRTNNQESSFRSNQYYSFTVDEISFLRIIDFNNLFKNKNKKDIEIVLTISNGVLDVNLPIKFIKTTKGQVLNFELCKQPSQRPKTSREVSELFNIPLGSDFKLLFLFTYINPIFLLPNKEPKYEKGYIVNKLHEAKANEVIRSILFNISPEQKKIKKEEKQSKLLVIENTIKDILQINDITFSKRLEVEDSYIKIFSKNAINNIEVEINQLGSGTINILNILSVLAYGDFEKFKLNALLLDEPDSHLHFNHQCRLYKYLEKVSADFNKQIFIITHNSSLISQFDNVIFVKSDEKILNQISLENYLENHLRLIDENHYNVMKELSETKQTNEKLEKEVNEIAKPTLYCEGTSDVAILKESFLKLFQIEFFGNELKVIGGCGEGKVSNIIQTQNTDNIIIGLLDNEIVCRKQKEKLINSHSFIIQDETHISKNNKHLLLIPLPKFRKDSAVYFENNCSIEYLFEDTTLENKLGVELIQYRGENFKRFDESKKNSIKRDIVNNLNKLDKEDYIHFVPLFEKIANIIGFKLPI